MSYTDILKEIGQLKHFHEYICANCGTKNTYHCLEIQSFCIDCGRNHKLRGVTSIGGEIQDVIDAVLEWVGTGKSYYAVMKRYQALQSNDSVDR